MQCPVDETLLQMTERQGVEIDYCPKCRGVWLDRGELDKIVERGGETAQRAPERHTGDHDSRPRHDGEGSYPKKKRKESFLGELFDF